MLCCEGVVRYPLLADSLLPRKPCRRFGAARRQVKVVKALAGMLGRLAVGALCRKDLFIAFHEKGFGFIGLSGFCQARSEQTFARGQ